MKKVLVSGSDGFIGRHLVRALNRSQKWRVVTPNRNNFDVTEPVRIKGLPSVNCIVHLASKTTLSDSYTNPHDMYFTNIIGTLNLLEYARIRKIRNFIYVSTNVYGPPKYLPIDESHPVNPHSPYNKSKVLGEALCKNYSEDYDMNIVILRPFNIYGPNAKASSLIASLINQIVRNGKVVLAGRGIRRDLLFIQDFTNLILKIVHKFPLGYNIYNVGSGQSHTLEEVVQNVRGLLGRKRVLLTYLDRPAGNEIHTTVADITNVSAKFDWKPQIDLESGLKKVLEPYM